MFEDRTKAHADHVGHGLDRMTTAAVGVLKAIHCSAEEGTINRITKDVVAFAAKDFDTISEKLKLDLHEPPISQVRRFKLSSSFFYNYVRLLPGVFL